MAENILIIGPTSGIGNAIAHQLAVRGERLSLAGKNIEAIEQIARDLRVRYQVDVFLHRLEATDFDSHASMFEECVRQLGQLHGVVCCQGYMADHGEAERDFKLAHRMIDINFTAAVSILNVAANYFHETKQGWICGVSSVAGDRGRQSNYLYGSTKAALSVYLQGLRNRLFKSGIHVLTVKPGFVDTAMTWGLLNPKSPLVASPEKVAGDVLRAIDKKRNVVYTPWFWWGILLIIKMIPEKIFKRLST